MNESTNEILECTLCGEQVADAEKSSHINRKHFTTTQAFLWFRIVR